jgi:hypothetical protein
MSDVTNKTVTIKTLAALITASESLKTKIRTLFSMCIIALVQVKYGFFYCYDVVLVTVG